MTKMDENKTDRQLLMDILIEQTKQGKDIGFLKKQICNHLRHHWAITIILLGSVVTLVVALIRYR